MQLSRLSFQLLAVFLSLAVPLSSAASNITELKVCPAGSKWVRVPFVQQPISADYFKDIQKWGMSNATVYLRDQVLPRVAANLVFLGFALVTLLAFLLWRLIRSFVMCCCPECGPVLSKDPVLVTRSGPMIFGKIVVFAFAVGIYVTAIVGLALADNTLVTQVFLQVDLVTSFGNKVVGNLSNVALSVSSVTPITQSLISSSAGLPAQTIASITSSANQVQSQVNSSSSAINPASSSVSSMLKTVNDTRYGSTGTSINNYYNIAVKVSQGLCGAAMLFSIFIVLFSAIHCPAGIALAVFVCLLFTCIFFLIGTIFALIMVLQVDTCTNLEPIVGLAASSQLLPVISYYFSATLPSQNVEAVLANSGLVNLTDIRGQIVDQINSAVSSLNGLIPSMPSSYQTTYTNLASTLTGSGNNIINAIGSSSPASALVGLISWSNINPLYSGVKASFCCVVLDQFTFLWSIFTALGWLLLVSCWAAMGVLGTLDKLPRSGWCCSCSCLTPNKVAAIAADEEQQMGSHQSPPSQMMAMDAHKPGSSMMQMQMVMVPVHGQENPASQHQSVSYAAGYPPVQQLGPPAQGYYPAVPQQHAMY